MLRSLLSPGGPGVRTAAALVVAGATLLPAAPIAAPVVQRARVLMGTVCVAQIRGADTLAAAREAEAALDAIAALEPALSGWRSDSELQRLNARAADAPVPCSPALYDVLAAALAAARETEGAFDPTVEPLIRAWDLRGAGRVPDAAVRDAARAAVDWRALSLDPAARTAHFARAGVALDLGGIGKGFALERAAATLTGADAVLLNFGGEILARTGDAPWPVTVAHPDDRLRPVVRLELPNAALSTSGQRERGLQSGRRFIGHILDPRRGEPVPTRATVSVLAADAAQADAYSTALLVMGRAGAARFAASHPEVGVLWLEPDGAAVTAWRWNCAARTAPGARVHWMN